MNQATSTNGLTTTNGLLLMSFHCPLGWMEYDRIFNLPILKTAHVNPHPTLCPPHHGTYQRDTPAKLLHLDESRFSWRPGNAPALHGAEANSETARSTAFCRVTTGHCRSAYHG